MFSYSSYGAASRSGVRPGDLIIAANANSIEKVEDLRAQAEKAGKSIALLVQRGEQPPVCPGAAFLADPVVFSCSTSGGPLRQGLSRLAGDLAQCAIELRIL